MAGPAATACQGPYALHAPSLSRLCVGLLHLAPQRSCGGRQRLRICCRTLLHVPLPQLAFKLLVLLAEGQAGDRGAGMGWGAG